MKGKTNVLRLAACVLLLLVFSIYGALGQDHAYIGNSLITNGWECIGLSGGGAQYNPAISPHDPNLIFTACDMNNAFRSEDGGRTWAMMNMKVISTCNKSRACFHPKDPNIVYYGSSDGLQRSRDKGKTWHVLPTQPPGGMMRMLISPENTNLFLIGSAKGLFRSMDAGTTWLPCTNVTGEIRAFFACKGSLFIGTDSGVFRSDDQGVTWNIKENGLPKGRLKDFCGGTNADRTAIYVLHSGNKIYKSLDKGEKWESAMSSLSNRDYLHIASAENNPDIVYMNNISIVSGVPNFDIYKTTDGGKTWNNCFILGRNSNVEFGWLDYEWGIAWPGRFRWGFTVSQVNPDYLLGSNNGETFITRNGGKQWNQLYCTPADKPGKGSRWISNGIGLTSCWNYNIDPVDRKRHYICYTDIGFARSEDGGNSWYHATKGIPWPNSVYQMVIDERPGVLFAAGSSQHDIPYVGMDHPNGNGGVVKSTDYGKTWTPVCEGLPKGSPATSIVKNKSSLFVAMLGNGVYRSDDDARTWVRTSNGLGKPGNANVYSLKFDNKGNIFCSIAGRPPYDVPGGLYKSSDRGKNWTLLKEFSRAVDFSIDPQDGNIIYVAACDTQKNGLSNGEGGVHRSRDGGKTWKKWEVTDKKIAKWMVVRAISVSINPKKHSQLFATWSTNEFRNPFKGGIMVSNDSGATWKDFDNPPFTGATRITWDSGSTMYVTTFGSNVWKKKF